MRKAKPKKRIILPDPKFGDVRVTKFVNHLMYDGKKTTSYRIFYSALELVGKKMANEEKTPLEIWKAALEKITPQVEVKSRRVGGATFQVPTEIRPDRKESVSMKNMIIFARKRGGKTMDLVLHGPDPQDGRGARGYRYHGLDGAGAGEGHHHHQRRNHRVLELCR